jgi:hypothetical protein
VAPVRTGRDMAEFPLYIPRTPRPIPGRPLAPASSLPARVRHAGASGRPRAERPLLSIAPLPLGDAFLWRPYESGEIWPSSRCVSSDARPVPGRPHLAPSPKSSRDSAPFLAHLPFHAGVLVLSRTRLTLMGFQSRAVLRRSQPTATAVQSRGGVPRAPAPSHLTLHHITSNGGEACMHHTL